LSATLARRVVHHLLEGVDLLFDQEARGSLAQLRGQTRRRRVRAMAGAERVVDVDVAELRELGDERRIVLGFPGVEAKVLEQANAAGLQLLDLGLRDGAHAVGRCRHGRPEQLGQPRGHRGQPVLVLDLPFRATEMRTDHDARARLPEEVDRRQRGANSRIIGDARPVQGNVEVRPDEDALVGDFELLQAHG
jgi:hypothetical protein